MLLTRIKALVSTLAHTDNIQTTKEWAEIRAHPDIVETDLGYCQDGALNYIQLTLAPSSPLTLGDLIGVFGSWKTLPQMSFESLPCVALNRWVEPGAPAWVAPFAELTHEAIVIGPDNRIGSLTLRRDRR